MRVQHDPPDLSHRTQDDVVVEFVGRSRAVRVLRALRTDRGGCSSRAGMVLPIACADD